MKAKSLINIYWFCQSVKYGGFVAASSQSNVSAATLSRAVAQLEEQMGEKLLYRNAKTFQLTSSGDACYRQFAPVFEQLDDEWAALASSQPVLSGDITISCPEPFADFFLQAVAIAFMDEHPEVNIHIQFAADANRFLEDQIDLAVITKPTRIPYLIQRQLFSVDQVLAASPEYLEKHGHPETVQALNDLQLLVGNTATRWEFIEAGNPVSITPHPRYSVNSLRLVVLAAVSGAGICMLSRAMFYRYQAQHELEQVLPNIQCPKGNAYVVWPDRKLVPARVAAFRDRLFEQMQDPEGFLSSISDCRAI